MRRASVLMHGRFAGILKELVTGEEYKFIYQKGYDGPPISLTMPTGQQIYKFSGFPAFFEGLLPEGEMLEGLLRQRKIDRLDYFTQLIAVGGEMVGAVTVQEIV